MSEEKKFHLKSLEPLLVRECYHLWCGCRNSYEYHISNLDDRIWN